MNWRILFRHLDHVEQLPQGGDEVFIIHSQLVEEVVSDFDVKLILLAAHNLTHTPSLQTLVLQQKLSDFVRSALQASINNEEPESFERLLVEYFYSSL